VGKRLKLALNTGYWAGGPPTGAASAIAEAERLGFDSVWCSEAYGSDALTPLAWWGSQTTRIRLGTAIAQMSARPPAGTAMAAMTLDHLSGGRFILGLGASGPQVVEGWYGMPFEKPLARTREYIGILRDIWARRGPVTSDGPHYPLPLALLAVSERAVVGGDGVAERAPRPRRCFWRARRGWAKRRCGTWRLSRRRGPPLDDHYHDERLWSGPAITVVGIDAPSVGEAVNAVLPYTRQMSRYASTSGCPSCD
jgi:hypothetical protein